jgi:Squalene-hopene cyclase C-terminal domain/Prenyltransferase and squalene oxidase repeat
MSWQVAVFFGLGLVLASGFAWYERARPPARLVALVAALAALAVAGRLVLAPIPNVVATTDVALLTGYSLGGAPGFAVGALAAPISNIWLGQGPWTAWQMAGWGLVGIGGAAVATMTARRLGRLGLAIVCALAGFAYGALLDFSVMVTYGGEQSLDRYLALSGRGVPFNVAHAAGNFAIAFAAGPALVRMISRYRTRLEFTWGPAPALPVAVLALALSAAFLAASDTSATGASAQAAGASPARAYLERSQGSDGGFAAAPGYRTNPAMTGWAMLGLEAAGRNPLDVRNGRRTPIAFLRSRIGRLRSTGDLERTILALAAAGRNPRRFAGRDLVAQLRSKRSGDGSFQGQVNLTAFGVLALRASGGSGSEIAGSAAWLRDAQNADGGWGFNPGAASDPDSTGAALQALAVAGGGSALSLGVNYLRESQRPEGGWGLNESGVTNTQSTAWAVQGLVAAGVPPGSVRRGGKSPVDYLRARQAADGHYSYSSASDQTPIWVTAQALLGVKRKAFPLASVPRAKRGGGAGSGSGANPATSPGSRSAPSAGGGGSATGGNPGSGGGDGRRTDRSTVEQRGAAGGKDGRRDSRSDTEVAVASATASALADAEPAAASTDHDGGPGTGTYVAAGLGLLACGLGAGFLWYRRRLP